MPATPGSELQDERRIINSWPSNPEESPVIFAFCIASIIFCGIGFALLSLKRIPL